MQGEVTKTVGAHLVLGPPDAGIFWLAQELDTGLVVVGSRGLGGIRRALIASVSGSVVRHAHCPAFILGHGGPNLRAVASRSWSANRSSSTVL
jgi:nucleotide-binding universal stress UspA family protein